MEVSAGCRIRRRMSALLRPSSSVWDALPDELVARVLVLLPFSLLPTARCVCAKWRAVVGSPLFANLCKAYLQDRGSGAWLIEFHQHMLNQAWAYDLSGAALRWFHLSFSFLPVNASIKATSGGLICLGSSSPSGGGHYSLFVCNPLTKEWKELPSIPVEPSVVAMEVDHKSGSYRVAAALPSTGDVLTYVSSLGGEAGGLWVAKHPRAPPDLEDAVLCNSILFCLVSSFGPGTKLIFLCNLGADAWDNPPLLAAPYDIGCTSYLLTCEEEEGNMRRLFLVSELKMPPRLSFHELHFPSMRWRHPVHLPKDANFCLSHSASFCFPKPREHKAPLAYISKSGENHMLVGTSSLPLPKSPLSRSKINHNDIILTSLWFQPRAKAVV